MIMDKPSSDRDRLYAANLLFAATGWGSVEAKEQLSWLLFNGGITIDGKTEATTAVKLAKEVLQANPKSIVANRLLGLACLFGTGTEGTDAEFDFTLATNYFIVAANQATSNRCDPLAWPCRIRKNGMMRSYGF